MIWCASEDSPPNNVLVIAPHHDDEVLGCGGTISKHVYKKDIVTVCVVADRVYGHERREEDVKTEMDDCEKARNVLGYQNLVSLHHPDEQLDSSLIGIVKDLEKIVADARPDIVYIPHRGDYNQDHRAVFDAAMVVCRAYSQESLKWMVGVFAYECTSACFAYSPFEPNYYVSIKDHLEDKKNAMRCYRRESREWPHPRSTEGIKAKARHRGMEVGLEAAEAFMVLRSVWD